MSWSDHSLFLLGPKDQICIYLQLTNDDGPPSYQSSPYVHSLIAQLQSAGHVVSVVLPHVQRSWIGKAHMVGQTLTPRYFRPLETTLPPPPPVEGVNGEGEEEGVSSDRPFNDGGEEWVLVDGTPASCVQLGLWHLFLERGPVDVVVSGPNYGRNTTALFSLSSGTLGGALEGAVCGKRAIALSYAFESRVHDGQMIDAASRVSQRLIEKLVQDWADDVHLYSINVPLKKDVEAAKIMYTNVLQNRWTSGSSFTEVEIPYEDEDSPVDQEKMVREGKPQAPDQTSINEGLLRHRKKQFNWAPKFADVHESVLKAGAGSDGWTIKEGMISVSPLKANFWPVGTLQGEIKL